MKYMPIIGLEIHVELHTNAKMFCGCSARHFQVKPNTHTCPVCLGLPGALPVPNQKAIQWCQLIGLALKCQLSWQSKFDRKNYFYPDLPKGYQITQYDQPLSLGGQLQLVSGKKIGINRVHMEEDTAKLLHRTLKGKEVTLIDFNRSGVPLVEIVTEPDFSSPQEVDEFLKLIQQTIRYLKVSDCDMEKGSMRLEVNMSLQKIPVSGKSPNQTKLPNYKVEIKNINSFRFVKKVLESEYERQKGLLEKGKIPRQETRGYDEATGKTKPQRTKEEAHDYRYFPEPDIPLLRFSKTVVSKLRKQLPELPQEKVARLISQYGLSTSNARVLAKTQERANYFEKAAKIGQKYAVKAELIANEIINRKVNMQKIQARTLVMRIKNSRESKITDYNLINQTVARAIESNPQAVKDYRAGKIQAIGRLIGEVMRATEGRAEVQIVKKLLETTLQKRS